MLPSARAVPFGQTKHALFAWRFLVLGHDSDDEDYHKMKMMMVVALLTQERLWRSPGSAPCSLSTSPTSYSRCAIDKIDNQKTSTPSSASTPSGPWRDYVQWLWQTQWYLEKTHKQTDKLCYNVTFHKPNLEAGQLVDHLRLALLQLDLDLLGRLAILAHTLVLRWNLPVWTQILK